MTQPSIDSSASGLPPQMVVINHDCKQAPYWLRVEIDHLQVDVIELVDANGPAMSLVAAVQAAVREGYNPTHYLDGTRGPWLIPSSIVRRPGTAPRNLPRSFQIHVAPVE